MRTGFNVGRVCRQQQTATRTWTRPVGGPMKLHVIHANKYMQYSQWTTELFIHLQANQTEAGMSNTWSTQNLRFNQLENT